MKLNPKIFAAMLVILMASIGSYFFLLQYFSQQETAQMEKRAIFFASTIDDALRRLDHLPFVISQNSAIINALETENNDALNPLLKSFWQSANADHIFLMDINGKTIAASNFESPDSFIGKSYTFRPYFQDAIQGKAGHFFAIGATTGEPGYFISAPVHNSDGHIFGVVVVKTGLDLLNQAWRNSGERILVSNADSVILLASKASEQFHTLEALSAYTQRKMSNVQQFANQPLGLLNWHVEDNGLVSVDDVRYLLAQAKTGKENWTVHLLSNLAGIHQQTASAIAVGLAILFGIIIAITSFRSGRLKRALRQSDADRIDLTKEIEVRKMAETELEVAKDELERASRLAALGQLSASITHELGQPISAMRNYLTAEEIAADAAPNSLNPQLSGLVDRMQNICNQLRFFATPNNEDKSIFDLRQASDAAIDLVKHGLTAENIVLNKHYATDAVNLEGNQQRVEQVLVNLLRNAIDAVSTQKLRRIDIYVNVFQQQAFVRVVDTGSGLGGLKMADIEEPFMTTKSSGQGMGLGLSISAKIARDMKGRIEAEDTETGGAEFTLWLPLLGVRV